MRTTDERPTDFYDALAPMFDVMTDWDARLAAEGPFLKSVLAGASGDDACWTRPAAAGDMRSGWRGRATRWQARMSAR